MKKYYGALTALFTAAACALRIVELRTGFLPSGLPEGNTVGKLLVCVLLMAAAVFLVPARKLPGRAGTTGSFVSYFPFDGTLPLTLLVSGALLLCASGVWAAATDRRVIVLAPALLRLAGGVSLFAAAALARRGREDVRKLLVPVISLVVQLVISYRANAADPVLAHFYVEILALAAMALLYLCFASFACGLGSVRRFFPLAALSAVLCACVAAQGGDPATLLAYIGRTVVAAAMLAAWQQPENT